MDSQHEGPIASPVSRIMDAKRRALALAEEGYYLVASRVGIPAGNTPFNANSNQARKVIPILKQGLVLP